MIIIYRFIYWDLVPCLMVTRADKAKPHIRRSVTRQKLEEGARDILKNGQVEVLDKNRYRVSSMSSDA